MTGRRELPLALAAGALALGACAGGGGYPREARGNFVTVCTGSGAAAAKCGCMYAWFEKHRSFDSYLADDRAARAGRVPADLYQASASCRHAR